MPCTHATTLRRATNFDERSTTLREAERYQTSTQKKRDASSIFLDTDFRENYTFVSCIDDLAALTLDHRENRQMATKKAAKKASKKAAKKKA